MCICICILQGIYRIALILVLMFENIVRMFMFNIYNIISTFCQICSVLPICMVFIITSNLKCIICNRSNVCCAGSQGQCPILASLVTLVVLYFVLDALHILDPILKTLGYVSGHADKTKLHPNKTETQISPETLL